MRIERHVAGHDCHARSADRRREPPREQLPVRYGHGKSHGLRPIFGSSRFRRRPAERTPVGVKGNGIFGNLVIHNRATVRHGESAPQSIGRINRQICTSVERILGDGLHASGNPDLTKRGTVAKSAPGNIIEGYGQRHALQRGIVPKRVFTDTRHAFGDNDVRHGSRSKVPPRKSLRTDGGQDLSVQMVGDD